MADLLTLATAGKLLALFKSRRAITTLGFAGIKLARSAPDLIASFGDPDKLGVAKEKLLSDIFDLFASLGGNLHANEIRRILDDLPADALDQTNAHLVRFTGCVLEASLTTLVQSPEFPGLPIPHIPDFDQRQIRLGEFNAALPKLAEQWAIYIGQQDPDHQPLASQDFADTLNAILRGEPDIQIIPLVVLIDFLDHWFQTCVTPLTTHPGLTRALAEAISPRLGAALSASIATDHPAARAALAKTLLRNQAAFSAQLTGIITTLKGIGIDIKGIADQVNEVKTDTTALRQGQTDEAQKSAQRHDESIDIQKEILRLLAENTAPARLRAYFYELQLACQDTRELDDSDDGSGDRKAPDIWDAFVPPGYRSVETSSEQIEAAHGCADQLTPPIADILPLLASDDHRRVVLLGDPGTGKSTLIQFIAAVIGGQKHLQLLGEPLRQCIPLPFILRQLAMHLGNDLATWTWETLERLFFTEADLRENRSKLCRHFTGPEDEWRTQIIGSDRAWFLIDGLDEIGDVAKRRALCAAVHEGMKKYPRARWLITSRIVGYEEASIDVVNFTTTHGRYRANPDGTVTMLSAPAVVTGGSVDHILKSSL